MNPPEIVVAGHLCLDIIPQFLGPSGLKPGSLSEVGPATFSTGGCVSNVGLALHTLGVRVALMGAVGQDAFGEAVKSVLHAHDPKLVENLKEAAQDATSYTLVISPPNQDRLFLHHAGCNDHYGAEDIDLERAQAKAERIRRRLASGAASDVEVQRISLRKQELRIQVAQGTEATPAG